MENLREQYREIHGTWRKVQILLSGDASVQEQYFKGINISQIDEVIGLGYNLFETIDPPKGFKPTFHLAKALATTTLPQCLSHLKNIESSQFNFIPSFLTTLNNLINALHTMLVFSDKTSVRENNAAIINKLSESISLIQTSQHELTILKAEVQSIYKKLEESIEQASEITEYHESSTENSTEIATLLATSKSTSDDILKNKAKVTALIEANENLLEKLTSQSEKLSQENERIKLLNSESDLALNHIKSLLPDATSAGLAHAFENRASKLKTTKMIWLITFISSIILLFSFSIYLVNTLPTNHSDYWSYLLQRIPLTAPLIWLGWFSAIQYGNILRVEEDYEFKAATSKAFAGYKDYMDYLHNIESEEADSALSLLSLTTIQILGSEPLRIYQKAEHDATPLKSLLSSLKGKREEK